ncbi:hypothetical protein GTP43_10240 [Vibrio cholerae]|nr:hypothetical protein [Vibrio cholerae]EGR0143360.1 hypothetical protein [Vibrio cholerae]
MEGFLKKFVAKHGVNTGFKRKLSLDDKLEKLSIDDKRKNDLQNCICKIVSFEVSDQAPIKKRIALDDLVGMNRSFAKESPNWLDVLESTHKPNSFDKFTNLEAFIDYMDKLSADTLPVVTEKDGKYYICGEGKHRLTIAKCIGVKTLDVLVRQAK